MGYQLFAGDSVSVLSGWPESSVNCCITSPPYFGQRDYGVDGQIGLEKSPDEFVGKLVAVFREVRRVLTNDGTLWVVIGDSYNAGRNGGHPGGKKQWNPEQRKYQTRSGANVVGLKKKDLIGVPWMLAFALRADGWYLRQDIVWAKPNPMTESIKDRPTRSHEYIFMLSKSYSYYYDREAVQEPAAESSLKRIRQANFANQTGGPKDYRNGTRPDRSARQAVENFAKNPVRNRRDVWHVPVVSYKGAHFATYPPKLIEPCVLAGCPQGGMILDPFVGSGTTCMVALANGRDAVGIDLNPDYLEIARERIEDSIKKSEKV